MKSIGRLSLFIALATAAAGCGRKDQIVRLSGVAYYLPSKHLNGFVAPNESGSGQYYIRLIPPGDYFWLVYDPRKAGRPNEQGEGVPTIPHVNDIRNEQIRVIQTETGPVVCKASPANDDSAYMRHIFTCGFQIVDAGVPWSVIIPGDLVASAPALKRRAELVLRDYRDDSRLKKT